MIFILLEGHQLCGSKKAGIPKDTSKLSATSATILHASMWRSNLSMCRGFNCGAETQGYMYHRRCFTVKTDPWRHLYSSNIIITTRMGWTYPIWRQCFIKSLQLSFVSNLKFLLQTKKDDKTHSSRLIQDLLLKKVYLNPFPYERQGFWRTLRGRHIYLSEIASKLPCCNQGKSLSPLLSGILQKKCLHFTYLLRYAVKYMMPFFVILISLFWSSRGAQPFSILMGPVLLRCWPQVCSTKWQDIPLNLLLSLYTWQN